MDRYDVFISYNNQEQELAEKLYKSFSKAGFSVFWDRVSILTGESIPTAISTALENSTHMICLMTQQWRDSEFCRLEQDSELIDDPGARNRVIIPLLVEKIELPKMFKRLKYIDFTNWKSDYRKLFSSLKKGIKKKHDLTSIVFQLATSLKNTALLSLCNINSASYDFILPDLYIEPSINAIKHQFHGLLSNFVISSGITHNIALVGIPGTGKTTIFTKLFLETKPDTQFRFYFTAKELIAAYVKKENMASIFKKLYNIEVSDSLEDYKSKIIFIDGIDEIGCDDIDRLFEFLTLLNKKNINFWISGRSDFYYRYILTDPNKMKLFYDTLFLDDWSVEQGQAFVKSFADKSSKAFIYERVETLLQTSSKINSFLENPFKVSLLIFILSDINYGVERLIANDFVLYQEFYDQWLTQENKKETSINDASTILRFHTNVAVHLFSKKANDILSNIIPSKSIDEYFLKNDSAFLGLLLFKERLGDIIIEKFYHETLMEFFLAKGIISSFISGTLIRDYLKIIYNNEVNSFVRSAFNVCTSDERTNIIKNLTETYQDILKETDNSILQRIREQIIYYIGRSAFDDKSSTILLYAYKNETNSIINRAAALSLIILGNEEVEFEYINKIEIGSVFDIENRSVQLVYFGDVQADLHKYRDDGIVSWERTKCAIIKRLGKSDLRDICLRLWDIVTLHSFCINRGLGLLTSDDIQIIEDTVITGDTISQEKSKRLSIQKNKLLNLLLRRGIKNT